MQPSTRMAIVRPYKPNLAEMAVYRPFLDEFEVTVFYTGVDEKSWRKQLDSFGLERMKAVRYRGYTDYVESGLLQRALDFKIGLGSLMLSHLADVLRHDIINVVDPIYAHVHQIVRRMQRHQKLVIVRWENIWGRYEKIWLAARKGSSALKRADVVICVSQAAMKTLSLPAGFGGTVAQVYPGIDLRAVRAVTRMVRKERPAILFTGRPQWGKGLDRLLAAFSIVVKHMRMDAELWVIGADTAGSRRATAALGIADRVHWFGRLPNVQVRQKMAEATVFCQPSLSSATWAEQFGFAMVEAMAQGLPIVAFDSGCIREVCGADGVYASTGNAHSLAQALAVVLGSPEPAKQRGDRLRARAMREFDADTQGLKMLKVIGKALDEPGKLRLAVGASIPAIERGSQA